MLCMFLWRALSVFAFVGAALAQTPVPIGRISGGDSRLRGQLEVANDGTIVLMSGAQVDVRNGAARLVMANGEARFCAPIKASVLKSAAQEAAASSGDPALLFAMDSGTVELEYTGTAAYTVQTPFFSVSTLPFQQPAPRRLAVHVAPGGDTCVAALTGTLRVREQVGPAEMFIPPGRAMFVPAAGVEKATPIPITACNCGTPVVQKPPVLVAEVPAGLAPAASRRRGRRPRRPLRPDGRDARAAQEPRRARRGTSAARRRSPARGRGRRGLG